MNLQHATDTTFDPATLASDLRVVCDLYDDFFASLDGSQWDTHARGPNEWTLHETIAHLCALNGAGLDSITNAIRGEPYAFVGLDTRYDLDAYNRHGIDDHLDLPSTELFAEFLRIHSDAGKLAESLTPAEAERTVTMPIYNRPIQIVEALAIIVMHAGLVHTAQVAEPASLPPLWTKLPADVRHRQIGRVMRAFSILYRHDIGDPLRASIHFGVDGPGGGDWHVDVSPDATESGEGAPDAPQLRLRFRSTDEFCRMPTVRLNLPLALVTRRLRVRGDLRLFRRMDQLFSVDAHPGSGATHRAPGDVVRSNSRRVATVVRAVHAGRTRAKSTTHEPTTIDGAALRALIGKVVDEARLVRIPANHRGWTPTGLQVRAGDTITWLAWGTAYVIKPLAIGVQPRFALAGRVRSGPVQQSGQDTYTFTADRDGTVEIASLFPGEAQRDGSIAQDRIPYRVMTGGFDAVVARWPREVDPRKALEQLAGRDPSGLCAAEVKRLSAPPHPPHGWSHHPLLRPADTYSCTSHGLTTRVEGEVGIIRHPVDLALTPSLRLRWSWRIDQLPSTLPEDTTLTHDYLSVAVEFDDGRDLTWHWSCSLPAGYTYRCPFDHWRRRETHLVVRTGTAGVGRWVDEERPVLDDHQTAIGGTPPSRVVAVWLISCSFLQGREGRAEFGRIDLVDGSTSVRVL